MLDLQKHFTDIYANDKWSSGSGTGSRPANNLEYINFVCRFIAINNVRSVVDLGCGDWQFSHLIDWSKVHYLGLDLVGSVISKNNELYGRDNIKFAVIDSGSGIPDADLLICKDVFQHLPNDVVADYLSDLVKKYRWLIITNDDYPTENLNGHIKAGEWRAIRLDESPFFYNCAAVLSWVVVSETPTVRKRTVLIAGNGEGQPIHNYGLDERNQQYHEIPRRIFQTWKVRSPLPPNFERWSRTIREINDDYVYVIHDDFDNREFISENYPWFLGKYDAYEKEILRVDAVRYFQLFHFGGFYFDLDVECLNSLDKYLMGNDVLFGRMGSDEAFPASIPNAIMASKPRQEFWLYVFSHLESGPTLGHVEFDYRSNFLKGLHRQME